MDSADKDATADRNVVPGAMAAAFFSSLCLSYSLSFFPLRHPHSLPFICLSSPLLRIFFLLFFPRLLQIHSLLHQPLRFSSYVRLHTSIPLPPPPSPPAIQLPPSPVVLILWQIKGKHSAWVPVQCLPQYVYLVGLQTEILLPVSV